MVKADRLKASVVEQNKQAAEIPFVLVELDCAGNLVSASKDGELLGKKHALSFVDKCTGEGARITKTFKDYDGRVEYGDVIQFKVAEI